MKFVFTFLILVFAANAALAFSARANLRSFAKAARTGKKKSSGLFSDDPDQDNDFNLAKCSVPHHMKRQYTFIGIMVHAYPVLVSLNHSGIIPINISQPHSNNLSDIFIPPRISL